MNTTKYTSASTLVLRYIALTLWSRVLSLAMRTKLRCSMSTRRVLFDTGVPVWSYGYAYVNRYPRAQIYTCAMVHSYHVCTHTCTWLKPLTHQLTDAWRSCVSSYSTTEYVSHGLLYPMPEPAEKAHSGSRWQIELSKCIFATQFQRNGIREHCVFQSSK